MGGAYGHKSGWGLQLLLLLLLALWSESALAVLVKSSSSRSRSLTLPGHKIESPGLRFVRRTVAAHAVVIFSSCAQCPRCRHLRTIFRGLGEIPVMVNLVDDAIEAGLLEFLGQEQSTASLVQDRANVGPIVPQVFIDGEHIGGFRDTLRLYESGRLKRLLSSKKAGG